MSERLSGRTPHSDEPPQAAGSRITGIDVARATAIFWMFVAHIGPDRDADGLNRLLWLGDGREAALFAFLAGVSLTLTYGATRPRTTEASRFQAKTFVRALILFVLGVFLASVETGVLVILPFFAVYFLLALPAVHWSVRRLMIWAVCWALIGPQVSFVLRAAQGTTFDNRVPEVHTLTSPTDVFSSLFLSGTYPAITWMPFVLAGMAIGKLDLRSISVPRLLVGVGTALAVLGYGGSWLLLRLIDGQAKLEQASATLFDPPLATDYSVLDTLGWFTGSVPTNDLIWLTVAQGHSGTTFEVVGATGVACAVLGISLLLCRLLPGSRLLAPIAAVGSMSLSVYTLHLLAGWSPLTPGDGTWLRLLTYTTTAALAATLWSHHFGKGPLERLNDQATRRL